MVTAGGFPEGSAFEQRLPARDAAGSGAAGLAPGGRPASGIQSPQLLLRVATGGGRPRAPAAAKPDRPSEMSPRLRRAVMWGASAVIAADAPQDVRPRSLIAEPYCVPPKLAYQLYPRQNDRNLRKLKGPRLEYSSTARSPRGGARKSNSHCTRGLTWSSRPALTRDIVRPGHLGSVARTVRRWLAGHANAHGAAASTGWPEVGPAPDVREGGLRGRSSCRDGLVVTKKARLQTQTPSGA